MSDELDAALRTRLTRLAEAVPVDRPGRVRSTAVMPRSRGGSIVGVFAVVVALLVIALVGTSFGGGPTVSPVPSAPIASADGPVVGSDSDESFRLTLRASKSRYAPDEPIDAVAELEYLGPEASIEVASDFGVPTFLVEEVGGDRAIHSTSLLICEKQRRFDRQNPVVVAWKKSGVAWNESGRGSADEAFDRAYFNVIDGDRDPVLRLPAGTWRLLAIAGFAEGSSCAGTHHGLSAEITVTVTNAEVSANSPSAAVPSHLPYELKCGPIERSDCERQAAAIVAAHANDGKTVVELAFTSACGSHTVVFDDGSMSGAFAVCVTPTGSIQPTQTSTPKASALPYTLLCGPIDPDECGLRAAEIVERQAARGKTVVAISFSGPCGSFEAVFDDGTMEAAIGECLIPSAEPGATPSWPTHPTQTFPFPVDCGPLDGLECDERATGLTMWHAGYHVGMRITSMRFASPCHSVTDFDDGSRWEDDHCARPFGDGSSVTPDT
jgi:hypothetical protein